MNLKISFTDDETGEKIILNNKGSVVFYHYSEYHSPKEFTQLTGSLLKAPKKIKEVIQSFYELASKITP